MEDGGAWGCRNVGWGDAGVWCEEDGGAQGMLEPRICGCWSSGDAGAQGMGVLEPGVRGCWSPGLENAGAWGMQK